MTAGLADPRTMDLLRFATAGSVDDGKSTLIGRLLFDSKSIFEDQLESVERTSTERGEEYTNLALLTWFAVRRELVTFDDRLKRSAAMLAMAGCALALALWFAQRPVTDFFRTWQALRAEATLGTLAVLGLLVYGGLVIALFGRQWLAALRGRPAPPSAKTE